MRAWWKVIVALLAVAAFPWPAQAGWGVGVTIGGPYYRPWYGYPYYYRPYGVYVVPPPIVVGPAPLVEAVPVPVPAPIPVPSVSASPSAPPSLEPVPVPTLQPQTVVRVGEVDQLLAQLNDADPQVRANAAVQLGRLRVRRAIDPLSRMLGHDRSPVAREAAARGLGLIGAPGGLGALQRAAQADEDREVRHSAQFAAEGIRAGLRGQ